MPLQYVDMCDEVRSNMISEIQYDGENLYISSWLNEAGAIGWRDLLIEACESGSDETLADTLRKKYYLRYSYLRRTKSGHTQVRVPFNAHETIAESNFSRFYLRAVCLFAKAKGVNELVGYRAMEVQQPRPGSEEKIGMLFPVDRTLDDLRRTMDGNPQWGMPPGVGSGILARLP